MLHRPIRILLVEDNPADARLVEEALKDAGPAAELYVAVDGEEAVTFLCSKDREAVTPRPDLIFLDINIPKINGHTVLKLVKNEPELQRIPIVMFTSSAEPDDIRSAYEHHANAYVQKPNDIFEYFSVISKAKRYWTEVAQLSAPVA